MRAIIKMLATEETDCPRLFTLAPERRTGLSRVKFYEEPWRCGASTPAIGTPGQPPPITFINRRAGCAPYAHLILKTLRVAVTITAALASVEMPESGSRTPNTKSNPEK